jgi:hypothetical protein
MFRFTRWEVPLEYGFLCACSQTKQSFDVLMQKQVWVAVQKTVTGS